MKTLACVGIVILLSANLEQLSGLEAVPEFQYPCFVDVCTFPHQYCNSDRHERRCSPCSASICREARTPTACKYICNKYATPTTTTPKPTPDSQKFERESDKEDTRVFSLQLIMIYCAVTTTLIAVLLIVLVAVCSMNQCNRYRPRAKLVPGAQHSFKSLREEDKKPEQQILLENVVELLEKNKNAKPPDQTPPSYTSRMEEEQTTPVTEETGFIIAHEISGPSPGAKLLQIRPTPDVDRGQHHIPWRPNDVTCKKTTTGCQSDLPEGETETSVKHSHVNENSLK